MRDGAEYQYGTPGGLYSAEIPLASRRDCLNLYLEKDQDEVILEVWQLQKWYLGQEIGLSPGLTHQFKRPSFLGGPRSGNSLSVAGADQGRKGRLRGASCCVETCWAQGLLQKEGQANPFLGL